MINADYTLRNVLNSQNSFHPKVVNEKKYHGEILQIFCFVFSSSRGSHDPSS